jgi:hypothetical protein
MNTAITTETNIRTGSNNLEKSFGDDWLVDTLLLPSCFVLA